MLKPEDSFGQHDNHRRAIFSENNIYYLWPLMCFICTDGAFEAVALVCALWFLDQQIQGRQK